MGIRVAFEAVDNGRPLAEAARLGFRYSCLVGLISMLIGLVVVHLRRARS